MYKREKVRKVKITKEMLLFALITAVTVFGATYLYLSVVRAG